MMLVDKKSVIFSEITCPSSLSTDAPTNGNSPTCSNSNNYGSSCTFTCTSGFGLSSTAAVECTGDGTSTTGTWSSAAPTCTGKSWASVRNNSFDKHRSIALTILCALQKLLSLGNEFM